MTNDRVFFRNDFSNGVIIDVCVCVVIVLYQTKRNCLELYEESQIFPDGTILHRHSFNGIGETMRQNEFPGESARRCLAEELGFRDPNLYTLSDCLEVQHKEPVASEKWPGLKAVYHRHIFECFISKKLFRPEGYTETEKWGKNVFKWKPRGQALLII